MDKPASSKRNDTNQELIFIKKVGTFTYLGRRSCRTSRKILLERYLVACEKRDNWGNLDKAAIVKFAKSELTKVR